MTAQNIKTTNKGFTLIELLVVIGILAILLAITLIAINPARQFAQARNTQRASDVNAILNAIHAFGADNDGVLPANMPAPGAAAIVIGDGVGQADICDDLVTLYIAAIPGDPQDGTGTPVSDCATAYDTQYEVSVSADDNRVTVAAPGTEIPPGEAVLSVTR